MIRSDPPRSFDETAGFVLLIACLSLLFVMMLSLATIEGEVVKIRKLLEVQMLKHAK